MINQYFYKASKKYLSLNSPFLPILLGLFLRLINIYAPLIGVHSWRQSDTAAIARNFYFNGMSFAYPQIDWGGITGGFVETEFPLYQYLVALSYKIFGVHDYLGRGLSVLFSCLTILVLFRLTKKYFNTKVAWWASLFYAFLPLTVYYGRTIQPESLMILLATFSLERWICFLEYKKNRFLLASWIAFTLAVLVKGLPFIWLGLPIFVSGIQKGLIRDLKFFLCPLLTLIIAFIWYFHAHQLGSMTGLSFGLWGSNTGRYEWVQLIQNGEFINTILRILFRNLLVLGAPLVILGVYGLQSFNIFTIGILSVFITGILNPSSFAVHEYYQLPLMIYFCPLMGRGFIYLKETLKYQYISYILLMMLFAGSFIMLYVDYWKLENPANSYVFKNSLIVDKLTKKESKIVGLTGGDPTLFYLSDRKGWLISPEDMNQEMINQFHDKGANYIAGSWKVIQSYNSFDDKQVKHNLKKLLCTNSFQKNSYYKNFFENSCSPDADSYVIPINLHN